jgi:DNA-binding transcriptional ArsR family regulator
VDAAVFAPSRGRRSDSRLSQLVGDSRARVIAVMRRPRTTAQLARDLKIAPSTASEHLTALTRAGILDRRRIGRRVLYQLSPRGQELLRVMSEDSCVSE